MPTMLRSPAPILLASLLLGSSIAACGADTDAPGGGGVAGDGGVVGPGGGGEGEGEGEAGGGPQASAKEIPQFESFQTTFYYPKTTRQGVQEFSDLYVTGAITTALASEWFETTRDSSFIPGRDVEGFVRSLTSHPETGASLIQCASCVVSRDGGFLAWAEVDPGTGQTDLFVAPVHAGWSIRMDLKRKAAGEGPDGKLDTRALGFAGDWLVYGTIQGDRKLVKAQRALDGTEDHVLHELPAGGGFIVDPRGNVVVTMLLNTLASMTVSAAVPSGGGDPTTLHLFEVDGASTGSDYSGSEKGAVSPSGEFLAIVTNARATVGSPADLALNVLATNPRDPGDGMRSTLRIGPGGQGACDSPRAQGEFTQVLQPPTWSPDGRFVYVLASNRAGCQNPLAVPDTDILRIPVAANGELGEPVNITQNRADWDHPRRLVIEQMQLSPDGKVFILSAVPTDGIKSTDLYLASARLNEVYDEVTSPDGGNRPDTTLFEVILRLTRKGRFDSRNPQNFPLR